MTYTKQAFERKLLSQLTPNGYFDILLKGFLPITQKNGLFMNFFFYFSFVTDPNYLPDMVQNLLEVIDIPKINCCRLRIDGKCGKKKFGCHINSPE